MFCAFQNSDRKWISAYSTGEHEFGPWIWHDNLKNSVEWLLVFLRSFRVIFFGESHRGKILFLNTDNSWIQIYEEFNSKVSRIDSNFNDMQIQINAEYFLSRQLQHWLRLKMKAMVKCLAKRLSLLFHKYRKWSLNQWRRLKFYELFSICYGKSKFRTFQLS